MFLFIQLLFIILVNATYNITCILVSAPKKIPMLTYTIDYFLNAYNFNHEGINIEEFYLVKGTPDYFPEMKQCSQKLKEAGIKVNEFLPEYEMKKGTDYYKKWENYYIRFWAEYSYNFRKEQKLYWTFKESLVNYYNYQAIDEILKKKKDYSDYVLFIEDDIAMKKTWFVELKELLSKKNDNESALKISYFEIHKPDNNGYYSKKYDCVFGFFGILLNKQQFRNWYRLSHFLPYGYCGDQFHCMMSWWFDKKIRMKQLWHHFGRDNKIIPKNPKYWN